MMPAPAVAQRSTCYHCGDACTQTVWQDDKSFCCSGCATVYTLLAQNNLCNYYTLNAHPGVGATPAEADSLDYLKDPALARQLVQFTDGRVGVVRFDIPNMHCSSCIYLLEQLHKLHPGIASAEVNFARKQVSIRFDWQNPGLYGVVVLLHRIGYPPLLGLDKLHSSSNDASKGATRRVVLQLGFAGFCLGNIMLLSFPDYLQPGGVSVGLQVLFGYISLALSIPLLLFSGADYLRTAWAGLRSGHFNIEQPLALGMLAMFVRSTIEIVSGTGMGYLDSLSGLLFFLLLGRYFQQLTYQRLAFDRDYRAYFPLGVTVVGDDGKERSMPLAKLQKGQRLVVRHGELVPADAILISGEAAIDYSYITGEAQPVHKHVGDLVYAGGRQLGSRIELVVQQAATQSSITTLWNHPAHNRSNTSAYSQLINSISRYFTLVVLALGLGSLLFWGLQHDWARGWHALSAVFIIVCPCALAFAAPFTYGHIQRVLGRYGFYLKNAPVVEQLANLDTLVFDKTGTLTQGGGGLQDHTDLTDDERALVANLASHSAHPLSKTLTHQLGTSTTQHVTAVHETVGQGIAGRVGKHGVRLGNANFVGEASASPEGSQVHVSIDGRYKGYYAQEQHYRTGLKEAMPQLRARYTLQLLSGDNAAARDNLLRWFAPAEMHFQQQPMDKLQHVQRLQTEGRRVAMLGDGLNDAGALQAAQAGIAITDQASYFTPASDAILSANALPMLPAFLRLARSSRGIVWACFGVSLIYNVIGAYFAVQGQLSPVVAAILMPFSSIGIIALATGLTLGVAHWQGLLPHPKADQYQLLG